MPRKIRELKADLKKAGFILLTGRGKGSHARWKHPAISDTNVTLAGGDGDDAKPYQERQVQEALAKVRNTDA